MKRILLLFLCFSMLFSVTVVFSSCKKDESTQQDGMDSMNTEDELFSNLTKEDYSSNGVAREFNILNNDSDYALTMMDSDNITTSMDNAIFSRNRFVEEQLGIMIQVRQQNYNEATSTMRTLAASGLYQYDICYNESWKQSTLVLEGIYKSVNDYEQYLDLDKPWWYDEVMEDVTIANNRYLVAGDMNMMVNESITGLAFNREIISNYGAESPYDLVKSGEWTFEKLYTISTETRQEGKYGIVGNIVFADAMIVGAGITMTTKDENGIIARNPVDDYFTSVYQTMVTYFFEDNGIGKTNGIRTSYDSENFVSGSFDRSYNSGAIFTSGQSTFAFMAVGTMRTELPGCSVKYGLVPNPKYNTNQSQYISYVTRPASLCGISVGIDGQSEGTLEYVCNVMEWLCAYSYKLVKPVYYDVILYGRISKESEEAEMLDVMFGLTDYGIKRIERDGVLALGMTNVLELCASDANMGISGRMRTISDLVDDTINTTNTYYQGK